MSKGDGWREIARKVGKEGGKPGNELNGNNATSIESSRFGSVSSLLAPCPCVSPGTKALKPHHVRACILGCDAALMGLAREPFPYFVSVLVLVGCASPLTNSNNNFFLFPGNLPHQR